jgi:hypothetical protein
VTTPSAPVYRKIPKGYYKYPACYDNCPICGDIKSKGAILCKGCRYEKRPLIQQPSDPSYRFIPLTQGQHAIVETKLYDWLMQWKWSAHWSKKTNSFYAKTAVLGDDGKMHTICMHRLILGLKEGDEKQVDHVNHDTLDNRRFINSEEQLRLANNSENGRNARKSKANTSGYKGVTFRKDLNKWVASIRINRKPIHLGFFDDPKDAYASYCEAAPRFHGKFACLG